MRRDSTESSDRTAEATSFRNRALCLLRAIAFFILDSGSGQGRAGQQRKDCLRLMKIALKAGKVCIDGNELGIATKVLERAAEFQEKLSVDGADDSGEGALVGNRLRAEYFAVRMTLVSMTISRLINQENVY